MFNEQLNHDKVVVVSNIQHRTQRVSYSNENVRTAKKIFFLMTGILCLVELTLSVDYVFLSLLSVYLLCHIHDSFQILQE
jgi:hydrogenase-4 membrane subunit HyfE